MKRHGNQKMPFGGDTGPPLAADGNLFMRPNNDGIPRSGIAHSGVSNWSSFTNSVANTRQSQNSEGIQSVDSSIENPDAYFCGSNALLNLDISASNFMNAMNFEAMAGSENEEHGDIEQELDDVEEQCQDQSNQEHHTIDVSVEIRNDLAEQQAAIEQAKLLHRFRQFREWQQQQQDLLMAQQQQQLLQLRGEQERVQRMIAQQRQVQWGGTSQKNGKAVGSPPKTNNSATKMASPRRSNQRLQGSVPPALVQGSQAIARRTTQKQTDEVPKQTMSTNVHMVGELTPDYTHKSCSLNGRPAPILPERPPTPDEYRERGNPNLDSDSNTISSRNTANNEDEDDGICSIPDSISETNAPQQPLTKTIPSHTFSQNGRFNYDPSLETRNSHLQDGLPNVMPQSAQPSGGLFEQAQQMQLQLLSQLASQSGLGLPNQLIPRGAVENGAFNLPLLNSGQQQPSSLHPGFLQNLVSSGNSTYDSKNTAPISEQHLLNTHGLERQDEYILERSRLGSKKSRSPQKEKHARLKPPPEYESLNTSPSRQSKDNEEGRKLVANSDKELIFHEEEIDAWDEDEDDDDEQDQYSEEEEDTEDITQVAVDEDERPIEGIGAKKKTFEELLEEELRREEERMKGGLNLENSSHQPAENSRKRPFLRRGEGIARFNKSNSAKPRKPKQSQRGLRPSHSAPPGGRSENKTSNATSTTPTSNPEKKTSGPRKIISKATQQQHEKTQITGNSSSRSGSQKKTTVSSCVNKPVPPTEPKTIKTRSQLLKNKQTSPKQATTLPPKQHRDTDSLGEISFQKRIKAKAKEEEYEADELEEFEILEELADDDVSFISNVSTVNKVVTQLKEAKNDVTQEPLPKQQIHKPRQVSQQQQKQQQEMKMLRQLQERKQKQEELAALNAKLKSLSVPLSVENGGKGKNLNTNVTEEKDLMTCRISTADTGMEKKVPKSDSQAKVITQRKIVSLGARSPIKLKPEPDDRVAATDANDNTDDASGLQQVTNFTDSEDDESDEESVNDIDLDKSDNSYVVAHSEEEGNDSVVKHIQVHTKNHDTNDRNNNENLAAEAKTICVENNNRNNRTSVTTGSDSSRSSNVLEAHSHTNSPSPVSHSLSLSGGSGTLRFDAHSENAKLQDNEMAANRFEEFQEVKSHPSSSGFDFGDEEEWDDTSHTDEASTTLTEANIHLTPESGDGAKKLAVTKTKVQPPTLVNGHTEINSVPQEASPPPTSKLVSRLFPNLRQESNKQLKKEQVEQQQKLDSTKQANIGEGIQSKVLRDKLMELESEIERFRSENSALTKLRKEREEGLLTLHKEMEEFEKQKEAELKRLNDFKAEETKKLKKERKLFDQYQKAARAVPNKKEREEIEILKKQVTDLQDEMKRKEQRWTSSTTRLRDRIETLETENRELKEEIQILEKKRLEAWQQRDAEKKSTSTAATSNPPLKKEDYRKTALAPTPQQQAPKVSDRDNALRLSSNMEELRAAMGGLSVKEFDDSVLSIEADEHERSFENKSASPLKNKEGKAIPRKKAPMFSVSNTIDRGNGEFEETTLPDGKIEKVFNNGSREILFPNGTRKQISNDGQSIIVSFSNGDVKQIMPDQRVVYYYSEAQTTHTTYPDGLEILQFPNNQVEKHYPDGTREISFPDNTIKYLFPSGVEESIFEDGTVIRIEKNGDKTMEFPNGQREVHTAEYKRREYPDGTMKTVYPDGRQETRYSSGRIRIKDKEGNVIVDKRV